MPRNQQKHLLDIGAYLKMFNIDTRKFKDGIPSKTSQRLNFFAILDLCDIDTYTYMYVLTFI